MLRTERPPKCVSRRAMWAVSEDVALSRLDTAGYSNTNNRGHKRGRCRLIRLCLAYRHPALYLESIGEESYRPMSTHSPAPAKPDTAWRIQMGWCQKGAGQVQPDAGVARYAFSHQKRGAWSGATSDHTETDPWISVPLPLAAMHMYFCNVSLPCPKLQILCQFRRLFEIF